MVYKIKQRTSKVNEVINMEFPEKRTPLDLAYHGRRAITPLELDYYGSKVVYFIEDINPDDCFDGPTIHVYGFRTSSEPLGGKNNEVSVNEIEDEKTIDMIRNKLLKKHENMFDLRGEMSIEVNDLWKEYEKRDNKIVEI